MTYRPDMNEPFSLKDLLKPAKKLGWVYNGLVTVSWSVVTDSDPIEDLRKWHEQIISDYGLVYYSGVEFYYGGRKAGKTQMYLAFQQFLLRDDRLKLQQVGPNLARLAQKINKKKRRKRKTIEMKPQRSDWRRQERRRSNKLPGR